MLYYFQSLNELSRQVFVDSLKSCKFFGSHVKNVVSQVSRVLL